MITNLLLTCIAIFHPFHISVTEIEYDEETNAIEIAQKVFVDDLGEAIKLRYGKSVDLFEMAGNEETEKWVKEYISSQLTISINGNEKAFNYLGAEIEEDVMWCYMEIEKVKKLKSLTVKSVLLTETFPDQMNLVHVKAFGETRSMRLRLGNLEEQFLY